MRRLAGSVLGALVVLLAIPSGGCLGDLMCSEGCFGSIDCADYNTDECSRHNGCSVVGSCQCAQPGCLVAVATDCKRHQTALLCGGNASCAWRTSCGGLESCWIRFDDANSCNANPACRWERNCN